MTTPDVDELRRRLRALGYLDAGVDRFVLAPARASRGPAALAALASVRVGVLAALLLGPAAAIGLGARLPGLVTGVRDAAVLAVYLGVLFGAAMAGVSLAVSFMVRAIFRSPAALAGVRARRFAFAAGALVTIAALAYLTLWWRTANAGFGWRAPAATALALVVAVAISLLLGHAVRIATLGVLAAAAPAAAGPRAMKHSWTLNVAAGALAFAGAAVLLVWAAPAEPVAARPPLTVVPTGLHVRVIAIDGVDSAILQQLADGGRLPSLAAAIAKSRAALAPEDTRDPARAWTTVATGTLPDVHGVASLETRRVAGVRGRLAAASGGTADVIRAATDLLRLTRPAVVSREQRRVKTIWEAAADAGLRTAVVNWWASWPAPPDSGIVVTDRAILRLERGGALDAEIAPASLYTTLRAAWPSLRTRARAQAAGAFDAIADRETQTVLTRSAELDATLAGIAAALPGPPRDLDVLYLPGLDIAQHTLLAATEPAAAAPSVIAARLDALRSYYVFVDRLVTPIAAPAEGELVMLVTEPGRVERPGPGTLAAAGRTVAPAHAVEAAAVDVAPTVLHALGVPLSRELAGHAVLAFFDGSFAARYPIRFVATYGPPSSTNESRRGQPLDQEMIDRLRSLGYVR